MSEYKGTKGFTVQNYTTDPDNPLEGQVWYNETTGALKVQVAGVPGAWSTDANMNTARSHLGSAENGPSSAALGYSGDIDTSPFTGLTTITESYNGTSWTEVNDVNQGRTLAASSGIQTAALFTAGSTQPAGSGSPTPSTLNESWNGTSWTEVGDINTARIVVPGTGTQTSSIIASGFVASNLANVESWNGSAWTEVNDVNTARRGHGCTGADNTSALIAGGNAPGGVRFSEVESWNGTSWTEVNDLNTARSGVLNGLSGTSTLGLLFGGNDAVPVYVGNTEVWNGTTWSEANDLNTARGNHGGGGSQAASITFAGLTPSVTASTELWSNASPGTPQTVTITTD